MKQLGTVLTITTIASGLLWPLPGMCGGEESDPLQKFVERLGGIAPMVYIPPTDDESGRASRPKTNPWRTGLAPVVYIPKPGDVVGECIADSLLEPLGFRSHFSEMVELVRKEDEEDGA